MPNVVTSLVNDHAFRSLVSMGHSGPELLPEFGDKYNCSLRSIQTAMQTINLMEAESEEVSPAIIEAIQEVKVPEWAKDGPRTFSVPISTQPFQDSWPRVSGNYALLSDIHYPYYDHRVIEQWLNESSRLGLKKFLLVGDTTDAGQMHGKRGKESFHGRRYQDDMDGLIVLLELFMECFSEGGLILQGNHDRWFTQYMRGEVDADWMFSKVFQQFTKIEWSKYSQCQLKSGGREFRVLHGANYSGGNPLGVAKQYAAKFESGIIMGHQHHSETGWSKSGKHQVVCMGGAHDKRRQAYINIDPKTNPEQTQSFCIVKEGYAKLYDIEK